MSLERLHIHNEISWLKGTSSSTDLPIRTYEKPQISYIQVEIYLT